MLKESFKNKYMKIILEKVPSANVFLKNWRRKTWGRCLLFLLVLNATMPNKSTCFIMQVFFFFWNAVQRSQTFVIVFFHLSPTYRDFPSFLFSRNHPIMTSFQSPTSVKSNKVKHIRGGIIQVIFIPLPVKQSNKLTFEWFYFVCIKTNWTIYD